MLGACMCLYVCAHAKAAQGRGRVAHLRQRRLWTAGRLLFRAPVAKTIKGVNEPRPPPSLGARSLAFSVVRGARGGGGGGWRFAPSPAEVEEEEEGEAGGRVATSTREMDSRRCKLTILLHPGHPPDGKCSHSKEAYTSLSL